MSAAFRFYGDVETQQLLQLVLCYNWWMIIALQWKADLAGRQLCMNGTLNACVVSWATDIIL